MSDDTVRNEAEAPQPAAVEATRRALLDRFGADFVALVDHMGLVNPVHIDELLAARPDEQDRLGMAWLSAATALEAGWAAQARRGGGAPVSLARYMAIRLPSPREALRAQQAGPPPPAVPPHPAAASAAQSPTPRERESARRRIRLERAIVEARDALLRVDALDRLVDADRQAVVAQLEDVMTMISMRLRSAMPGGEPD
ncbi:MAG: hypothetical protein FJ035_03090 [Chloroflexi bacterium]|nr:hypothetical protein [Chloroflexota bacterium]